MRRNIVDPPGVSADPCPVADGPRADPFGARSDEDVVAQDGAAPLLGADRHLVFQVNPATAAHGAVDHDSAAVDQHQPRAELSAAPDDAVATDDVELVEDH